MNTICSVAHSIQYYYNTIWQKMYCNRIWTALFNRTHGSHHLSFPLSLGSRRPCRPLPNINRTSQPLPSVSPGCCAARFLIAAESQVARWLTCLPRSQSPRSQSHVCSGVSLFGVSLTRIRAFSPACTCSASAPPCGARGSTSCFTYIRHNWSPHQKELLSRVRV